MRNGGQMAHPMPEKVDRDFRGVDEYLRTL
jgi:hypothetical protein